MLVMTGSQNQRRARHGGPPQRTITLNKLKTTTQKPGGSMTAAAHLGAAVICLRRKASQESSPPRYEKLLQLATALADALPAVETAEAVQ
jgi:hypothetical protein